MSIKAMTWAWDLVDLPRAETLVLLALADHADEDNVCWPSQAMLAQKSRGDQRSVRRALASLKAAGLIEVVPRSSQAGRRSNMYRLNLDADFSVSDQQPDILSGCESSEPSAPVDNLAFPRETTNRTFCPVAEMGGSQPDTGDLSQPDTGDRLLPYREKNHQWEPTPHQGVRDVAAADGVSGRGVDVDKPDREGVGAPSAAPPPAALGAGEADWELLRECLPQPMLRLDERAARKVTALLRERIEAGWWPAAIRELVGENALPSVVKNLSGLVITRVSWVPLAGAPKRKPRRQTNDTTPQDMGGPALHELPPEDQPAWYRAWKNKPPSDSRTIFDFARQSGSEDVSRAGGRRDTA